MGGLQLGGAGAVGYLRWMTTPQDLLYTGYRYLAELISYAVWLYFWFPLSLRQVAAASATVFFIHDQIANIFSRRPNQDTASKFRIARNQIFITWAEVTGVAMAA